MIVHANCAWLRSADTVVILPLYARLGRQNGVVGLHASGSIVSVNGGRRLRVVYTQKYSTTGSTTRTDLCMIMRCGPVRHVLSVGLRGAIPSPH